MHTLEVEVKFDFHSHFHAEVNMVILQKRPPRVENLSPEYANAHGPTLKLVSLETLRVNSQRLDPFRLQRVLGFQEVSPVGVIECDGIDYLHDGHHRAWVAWIKGERFIKAWVTVV